MNALLKHKYLWAIAGVALWWYTRKPCACNK